MHEVNFSGAGDPLSSTTLSNESQCSGMAWGPVIAGAVASAAVVLLLSPITSAFGFAAYNPWNIADSSPALTAMAAIWLIIAQWLSAGLGGYLTGRLRTSWVNAHANEVFFRDTAHGFLSWALGTVVGTLLLVNIFSHAMSGAASHASRAAETSMQTLKGPVAAYTDTLFRNDQANANVSDHDRLEAARILASSMTQDNISQADRSYLVKMIATRSAVSEPEANQRIDAAITKQKTAADEFRKGASMTSLLVMLSMLIGAFIASVAAALGGQHRDIHYEKGTLTE